MELRTHPSERAATGTSRALSGMTARCVTGLREPAEVAAGASRGLPVLRMKKQCIAFLTFRVFGSGAHKKAYVNVDWDGLWVEVKSSKGYDQEMLEAAWNGVCPGNHKKPANAYAKNI